MDVKKTGSNSYFDLTDQRSVIKGAYKNVDIY